MFIFFLSAFSCSNAKVCNLQPLSAFRLCWHEHTSDIFSLSPSLCMWVHFGFNKCYHSAGKIKDQLMQTRTSHLYLERGGESARKLESKLKFALSGNSFGVCLTLGLAWLESWGYSLPKFSQLNQRNSLCICVCVWVWVRVQVCHSLCFFFFSGLL